MHRMVHAIQRIARHEALQRHNAALGVVTSVHGANGQASYACTVQLRESGLVLPKVPIATGLIGMTALPRERDLVVVLFASGDLHAPVVVGRLYSDEVDPPAHGPGEVVVWLPGGEEAPDRSLVLRLETPGDGTRKATLVLDGDVRVAVEVGDGLIRLEAQDAVLELTQDGAASGAAELAVAGNSVRIDQTGDVSVVAEGKLKLKAREIEISADTTLTIKGQMIDLN